MTISLTLKDTWTEKENKHNHEIRGKKSIILEKIAKHMRNRKHQHY